MTIYSVYKITNTINGKCYIGYSNNPYYRWKRHSNGTSGSKSICDAILKYGLLNFKFDIIYQSMDKNHTLNFMEPYFIELYDSKNSGYNQTMGGEAPMQDRTHSIETKNKFSESRKGNKNSMYGRTHSKETKQILSDISKTKCSGTNNGFYGRKHTEEYKRRASELRKGIIPPHNPP